MSTERIKQELEKENLETKLDFLKYQLSPHFFMNTLNNIHSLVDISSEKAKDSIIKLSKLMRYLLYDSAEGKTSMQKEIDFMKNYIELMKLRFSEKVKLDVSLPENTGNIKIPPLLFISFLENAFKHGISYQEESFIIIHLKVSDNKVYFYIKNSNHRKNNHNEKGIGLDNIKKRLYLLYQNSYELIISDDKEFIVELTIPADESFIK